MSGPPLPTHRNVNEPEPKYCALCGLKVGGNHIQRATSQGLRGFPICDVTPGCRKWRHAITWRDRFERGQKQPVIGQAKNPVYTPGAPNPFCPDEE